MQRWTLWICDEAFRIFEDVDGGNVDASLQLAFDILLDFMHRHVCNNSLDKGLLPVISRLQDLSSFTTRRKLRVFLERCIDSRKQQQA